MIVVVDMEDGERIILATFSELDFYKVLAVAPAVVKGRAHRVYVVVGIKGPMTLFCVAYIFVHRCENWRFDNREREARGLNPLAEPRTGGVRKCFGIWSLRSGL